MGEMHKEAQLSFAGCSVCCYCDNGGSLTFTSSPPPSPSTCPQVETDDEKAEVLKLGGLHVIGTERHESRRIDNQLRGRSGRQGDPGSTRFFLSLEDNLFRVFGGDQIQNMMNMFQIEDLPIESQMLTNSLDNVQKKVESYFFDIRKNLFEYDQVWAL